MDEIESGKPPQANLEVLGRAGEGRSEDEEQETGAHSDERNRKLDRNGWLEPALGEERPERAHHRREQHD
jgi:hypothetical protein